MDTEDDNASWEGEGEEKPDLETADTATPDPKAVTGRYVVLRLTTFDGDKRINTKDMQAFDANGNEIQAVGGRSDAGLRRQQHLGGHERRRVRPNQRGCHCVHPDGSRFGPGDHQSHQRPPPSVCQGRIARTTLRVLCEPYTVVWANPTRTVDKAYDILVSTDTQGKTI